MKKVRYYLVVIALVVTLSGPTFLWVGAESVTNVASSQCVRSALQVGKSTESVAWKRIRYYLAAIALAVILSGSMFLGVGAK